MTQHDYGSFVARMADKFERTGAISYADARRYAEVSGIPTREIVEDVEALVRERTAARTNPEAGETLCTADDS